MKLKSISRTATFAWDNTSSSNPLIVTGAIAGALDATFSNESQLEIWEPDFSDGKQVRLGGEGSVPKGSVSVGSRFNRLAWSSPVPSHNGGLIAAGMETGEVAVYDPSKIVSGASADDARIYKNSKHTGPVRGVDFNQIQKNLLLTGAINAELFIHDLNNPTNAPIPPGPLSTRLKEITSLQWNPTVSRVFAASSSSGYTSVWDLKAGKEIVSLQYGGGAAKGMDMVGGQAGLQIGKRRGMSDVCWHPEQDDDSPVIMLWDLRNTRAPEKILSGHHKGVLSVAWCKQDADLLLSCGKDNRTLIWNPQIGDIVGELSPSSDWSFQTAWCPRNPDFLATASFDGQIGIHSVQTTHVPEQPKKEFADSATADDIFGALGNEDQTDDSSTVLSLQQPPKWLKRPVSATFGFGGLLASVSNLPGASGKHQSGVVHLRTVVTEQTLLDEADKHHSTEGEKEKMAEFCAEKAESAPNGSSWKTLQTMFKADSRDEWIQLLGFSKEDVAKRVSEAIQQLPDVRQDGRSKEQLVTFADLPKEEGQSESTISEAEAPTPPASTKAEATPSEVSAASDVTKRTEVTEMTEQSLFDDDAPGTPAAQAADFFSSMSAGHLRNPQLDSIVPHKPEVAESSVAATIGSRGSSVRSENIKDNTFHIYPSGESDIDRLITQALVLGDFASAVELCLASERYADALLLAVRGGPELLQSTQKAYFARRTTSLPFLRVFQSIVTEDLADIVQNANLEEWKVVFAVICTFATDTDFSNLADQLGQRLQFRWQMMASSDSPEAKEAARDARQDAVLCYLTAKKLDKVIVIWSDEMREEEDSLAQTMPRYSAHSFALQSFVQKVAVFSGATGYKDYDIEMPADAETEGARSYKLAGLYDRMYEYADLLANQGQVSFASSYVDRTPSDYLGTEGGASELDKARDRIYKAADKPSKSVQTSEAFGSIKKSAPAPLSTPARQNIYSHPASASNSSPYYVPPSAQAPPTYAPSQPSYPMQAPQPPSFPSQNTYGQPQQSTYDNSSPYAPPSNQGYQPPNQSQGYQSSSPYAPTNGYAPDQSANYGSGQYGVPPQAAPLAPPPRASSSANIDGPPAVPAAQRRDLPGWNDAPSMAAPPKRPASAAKEIKPIMSPFPMSEQVPQQPGPPTSQFSAPPTGGTAPPPPRAAPGVLPPPPKGGPRPASVSNLSPPQAQASKMPNARPPSRGPPPGVMAGPPPRALSPLGPKGRVTSPLSGQVRPPPGPQQRMAGPPPPGRASSIASPPPQAQPSPPAPAPPSEPSKPTYPTGDRSHIPDSSKPVYEVLHTELSRVKAANLPPHLKRIVDDTERRLNILFDGLNNDTVPKHALDQMHQISKAMQARDANGALAIHVDLLTTATGEMTAWAPGVKQLIRLGL